MDNHVVHVENDKLYKLTVTRIVNNTTYYRCSHWRPCRKQENGCSVTGIKRDGAPLEVQGLHSCGHPLKIQPPVDPRVLTRVNELARTKNYSSIQLATEVQKEFSGGLDEGSEAYLRSDFFLDSIRTAQKSFRDRAYQEVTILADSQELPDPFTHVPVDRTSKDIFFFYKERLNSLPKELKLFVDDTFQSVPSGFVSCLNIMGYDSNREEVVPLFHSLMSDNTADSYCSHLYSFASNLRCSVFVTHIMTDFSQALLLAVEKVFPKAISLGCRFHFLQAIRRNLDVQVKNRTTKEEILEDLSRLSLNRYENEDFRSKYSDVKNRFPSRECIRFFEGYFEPTWVQKYPPPLWVHNEAFNTNNPVESFHASIIERLRTRAKTVEIFKEILKDLYRTWSQNFFADVPRRRRRERGPKRGPYHCSICGKVGHTAKTCPRLKKKKKT